MGIQLRRKDLESSKSIIPAGAKSTSGMGEILGLMTDIKKAISVFKELKDELMPGAAPSQTPKSQSVMFSQPKQETIINPADHKVTVIKPTYDDLEFNFVAIEDLLNQILEQISDEEMTVGELKKKFLSNKKVIITLLKVKQKEYIKQLVTIK